VYPLQFSIQFDLSHSRVIHEWWIIALGSKLCLSVLASYLENIGLSTHLLITYHSVIDLFWKLIKKKTYLNSGFILRILWCSQSDDHPKKSFRQIWLHTRYESRKKKNRIVLYSWLPTGTYHNNLVMWKKYSSNFGLEIQNMLNIKSRNKEINENEKKVL
jgi:hypothetical protein